MRLQCTSIDQRLAGLLPMQMVEAVIVLTLSLRTRVINTANAAAVQLSAELLAEL